MEDNVAIAINEFFARRDCYYPGTVDVPEQLKPIERSLSMFRGKMWGNGGTIPDPLIFNKRNFCLVHNIKNMAEALDIADRCINNSSGFMKTPLRNEDDVVSFRLAAIRKIESEKVIPDHIGGIFLLYLELCERVELA